MLTPTSLAVKDILGNIENGLISKVLESKYGGDESKIPTESYLARKPTVSEAAVVNTYGIKHSTTQGSDGSTIHVYDISSELPPHGEWLDTLAGPKSNWLRAFLTSISIVQGSKVAENQAARVFAPRPKQRVKIVFGSDGNPSKVEVSCTVLWREHTLTESSSLGLWCNEKLASHSGSFHADDRF